MRQIIGYTTQKVDLFLLMHTSSIKCVVNQSVQSCTYIFRGVPLNRNRVFPLGGPPPSSGPKYWGDHTGHFYWTRPCQDFILPEKKLGLGCLRCENVFDRCAATLQVKRMNEHVCILHRFDRSLLRSEVPN